MTNPALWSLHSWAFHPCRWPIGRLRTHSFLQPLQKTAPRHPQLAQRKQRHQMGRVPGQPPVLDFGVAELPFDDTKWVFRLGPDTRLGLLQLVQDGAQGRALVQRPALARAHGHMPLGSDALRIFALGHTLVTRIGKRIGLRTMEQLASLRHAVDVGGRARHGVHPSAIGLCTDVAFHSKGPLISLLALVHPGVTFPVLVLARTGLLAWPARTGPTTAQRSGCAAWFRVQTAHALSWLAVREAKSARAVQSAAPRDSSRPATPPRRVRRLFKFRPRSCCFTAISSGAAARFTGHGRLSFEHHP